MKGPFRAAVRADVTRTFMVCTGWSKILCAPDDYSTKKTRKKYSIL